MTVQSRRALGRATLARQLLLQRSNLSVLDAVEHLVGLQAQTPHTWYVGLQSRLEGVRPETVSELLESRQLVRIDLMRATNDGDADVPAGPDPAGPGDEDRGGAEHDDGDGKSPPRRGVHGPILSWPPLLPGRQLTCRCR